MFTKFIILGSGSSLGVPRADGYSGACNLNNKKNHRSRCSALIQFGDENFLIDTSPDLRQQLLSNQIKSISKVFYTHFHADQTHGINDLRVFFLINKKKIPIYADKKTSRYLNTTFKYCFQASSDYPSILKLTDLKKFINEAKYHTLAIAAGNSHGLEKSDINLKLYKYAIEYNKKIKLVFHGASGVKISFLQRISKLNFVKINYSSILKKEMMRLILKYKNQNDLFDQIKFNEFIRDKLIIFFSKMLRKYK